MLIILMFSPWFWKVDTNYLLDYHCLSSYDSLITVLVIGFFFQITLLHSMLIRPLRFHHCFKWSTIVACYQCWSELTILLMVVSVIHLTFQIILHSMLIRPSCFHHGFGRSIPRDYLIIMVYLFTILFIAFLMIHLTFQSSCSTSCLLDPHVFIMLIISSHFHHGFGRSTLVAYVDIMVYMLIILLIAVQVIHLDF